MDDVTGLDVYNVSMDLVEAAYRLTASLPRSERFGLVSQMQRASTSVPMNIAEGYGRKHRGDYVRALSIARGSVFELETQLRICIRLEFLTPDEAQPALDACDRVRRMLARLISRLAE